MDSGLLTHIQQVLNQGMELRSIGLKREVEFMGKRCVTLMTRGSKPKYKYDDEFLHWPQILSDNSSEIGPRETRPRWWCIRRPFEGSPCTQPYAMSSNRPTRPKTRWVIHNPTQNAPGAACKDWGTAKKYLNTWLCTVSLTDVALYDKKPDMRVVDYSANHLGRPPAEAIGKTLKMINLLHGEEFWLWKVI